MASNLLHLSLSLSLRCQTPLNRLACAFRLENQCRVSPNRRSAPLPPARSVLDRRQTGLFRQPQRLCMQIISVGSGKKRGSGAGGHRICIEFSYISSSDECTYSRADLVSFQFGWIWPTGRPAGRPAGRAPKFLAHQSFQLETPSVLTRVHLSGC